LVARGIGPMLNKQGKVQKCRTQIRFIRIKISSTNRIVTNTSIPSAAWSRSDFDSTNIARRAARAKEFALAQIDKMSDASATGKERTERKRRPTRGPTEFRQGRLDQPRKGRFRKTDAPPAPVFVLEIDGQPILAFKAATFRQARELGKEDWLQEDLKQMTIGHRPLWDGSRRLGCVALSQQKKCTTLTRRRRTLWATCLWSIWFSATMKRIQAVPSLVDHFRPGDDFEATPYRRTGATPLTNEIVAT
jgi:hypothetical protein